MEPDEMHLHVRKELADEVAEMLFTMFEKSWLSGEVPTDYKSWDINPIF